jgi:hypothetical protein
MLHVMQGDLERLHATQEDIDTLRNDSFPRLRAEMDIAHTGTLDFLNRNLDSLHKDFKFWDDQISTNADMVRRHLDGVKALRARSD